MNQHPPAHHCSAETRQHAFAVSPLTQHMSDDERTRLAHDLLARSWGEGETIFRAGDTLDGSYLILAGHARILRNTAEGQETTLDIAVPGDVIGPLQADPEPLKESALALDTTCALFIPAHSLESIVREYPTLAVALMNMQYRRLMQSRQTGMAQSTQSVTQRVACVLLLLDRKTGYTRSDGTRVLQVKLPRTDVAGMAGTTVESTSRVMAQLKKNGVIDSGREWVHILDLPELRKLAE